MNPDKNELQVTDWGRVFPWLHLFRAFRIAIDIRKVFLAGIAMMAWTVGNQLIGYLPFAAVSDSQGTVWHTSRPPVVRDSWHLPQRLAEHPGNVPRELAAVARHVVQPLADLATPISTVFSVQSSSFAELATAWTRILWWLVVWAFFGGALTRMAAVQFAADERISVREAFRFSGGHFGSYLAAPVLPIIAIVGLAILCALGGLIARIPVVGEWLIGVGFVIPLFFAFVMALVIIGVTVGWPLMYATISVEGTDAFDGFSRSYSYVYSRPWMLLGWSAIALVYGIVLTIVVALAASLIVSLAMWGVTLGLGSEKAAALFLVIPPSLGIVPPGEVTDPTIGTMMVAFWLHLFAQLMHGFTYSFFWTSATILYFLVRRSDDATNLEEVYRDNIDEEDDLLPIVGVAASDQPVIERPIPDVPEEPAEATQGLESQNDES